MDLISDSRHPIFRATLAGMRHGSFSCPIPLRGTRGVFHMIETGGIRDAFNDQTHSQDSLKKEHHFIKKNILVSPFSSGMNETGQGSRHPLLSSSSKVTG